VCLWVHQKLSMPLYLELPISDVIEMKNHDKIYQIVRYSCFITISLLCQDCFYIFLAPKSAEHPHFSIVSWLNPLNWYCKTLRPQQHKST
jgi:hypothetical protein